MVVVCSNSITKTHMEPRIKPKKSITTKNYFFGNGLVTWWLNAKLKINLTLLINDSLHGSGDKLQNTSTIFDILFSTYIIDNMRDVDGSIVDPFYQNPKNFLIHLNTLMNPPYRFF